MLWFLKISLCFFVLWLEPSFATFLSASSFKKDIIFGGHVIQIFGPSYSIRALTGIAMVFVDRKVAKEGYSQRTKKPREIFKNHNKFAADLLLEQTQNLLVVWLLKVEEITMGYGSALHNKLDFVTSCNTKVCLTEVILTFLDTLFVRSQKASNFFFLLRKNMVDAQWCRVHWNKISKQKRVCFGFSNRAISNSTALHKGVLWHTIWSNDNGFINGLYVISDL